MLELHELRGEVRLGLRLKKNVSFKHTCHGYDSTHQDMKAQYAATSLLYSWLRSTIAVTVLNTVKCLSLCVLDCWKITPRRWHNRDLLSLARKRSRRYLEWFPYIFMGFTLFCSARALLLQPNTLVYFLVYFAISCFAARFTFLVDMEWMSHTFLF